MSPSRRAPAIPILSPVLFIHVGHPYIPFLKFEEVLIYLYFIIEQDTFFLWYQIRRAPLYVHVYMQCIYMYMYCRCILSI